MTIKQLFYNDLDIFSTTTKYKTQVKDYISQSVHKLVDHAKIIVSEDLITPICSKSRGKNQNRRLSAWVKGMFWQDSTILR